MKIASKLTGVSMAAAAATLLLAGCSGSGYSAAKTDMAQNKTASAAKVKCSGINSCKGKSACATASSACQGQNSCKGKGWIKATKAECSAKGGKVIS